MEMLLKDIVDEGVARGHAVIKATQFSTVIGSITACAIDDGVCLLEFSDSVTLAARINRLKRLFQRPVVKGRHALFSPLRQELKRYLAGKEIRIDVPLVINGTDFQQQIWQTLLATDYGETLTYTELAERSGNQGSVRAAAAANGANPLSIVVPCHRIQGRNGDLTGYGGGISRKAWLLKLESLNKKPKFK